MRAVAMKSDPSGISNLVELIVTTRDSRELSYLKIDIASNMGSSSVIVSVPRITLRPPSLHLNIRQATFLNFGTIYQENVVGESVFGAMFVGVAAKVTLRNRSVLDKSSKFGLMDYTISTQSCSEFSANTASV